MEVAAVDAPATWWQVLLIANTFAVPMVLAVWRDIFPARNRPGDNQVGDLTDWVREVTLLRIEQDKRRGIEPDLGLHIGRAAALAAHRALDMVVPRDDGF